MLVLDCGRGSPGIAGFVTIGIDFSLRVGSRTSDLSRAPQDRYSMLLTVTFSLVSSLIVRLSASLETGFSSSDRRLENWQEGTKSPRTHSEPRCSVVSPATFG